MAHNITPARVIRSGGFLFLNHSPPLTRKRRNPPRHRVGALAGDPNQKIDTTVSDKTLPLTHRQRAKHNTGGVDNPKGEQGTMQPREELRAKLVAVNELARKQEHDAAQELLQAQDVGYTSQLFVQALFPLPQP